MNLSTISLAGVRTYYAAFSAGPSWWTLRGSAHTILLCYNCISL